MLSHHRLHLVHSRLSSHHSKDPGLLRRVRTAMAETSRQPWRCHWCRRLNKHHAATCGSCYMSWEKCIDIHYTHGQKAQPNASTRQASRKTRNETDWDEWSYWEPSPRRQGPHGRQPTPSPRRKPRGKTPKKRVDKAKGYGAPALEPPWQSAPATTASAQPHAAPSHLDAAEGRL